MACGAGRGLQPPPRHSVRSAARWACAGRCTFAGSCERAQRPVAPAGGRPATAHLTATLDGHGATKNASSQRASVAEPPPLQSPLEQNARSSFLRPYTAALHLSAKGEKGAQLRRASPTQPSRPGRAAGKGRLLPSETRDSPLTEALGHATLGCPGPSSARSSNGPSGALGSSLATWPPALGRDRADSHGGRPGRARSSLTAKQRLRQAQRTRHQHELGHSEHLRARGTRHRKAWEKAKRADGFHFGESGILYHLFAPQQ